MNSKLLLIALIISTSTSSVIRAQEPPQLQAATTSYRYALRHCQNAEQARQHYLDSLAAIRAGWPHDQPEQDFEALDAEVRRYPFPEKFKTAKLRRLLIGRWRSPRHDYLYSADGTLIMLPKDAYTTPDHWHIEGNRFSDGRTGSYTIILLDRRNFIFDNGGEFLFYEKRLSP